MLSALGLIGFGISGLGLESVGGFRFQGRGFGVYCNSYRGLTLCGYDGLVRRLRDALIDPYTSSGLQLYEDFRHVSICILADRRG